MYVSIKINFPFCRFSQELRFKDELLLIVILGIEPYFPVNVVCLKSGSYPRPVRS